jgi:DNA-binding response OmpR family regulator
MGEPSGVGGVTRVLVIDDDSLVLELVSRALASADFEVAVARTLPEIAQVTAGFAPDAVLVDVNIPGSPSGGAVDAVRGAVPSGARVFLFSSEDEAVLRTLARRTKADGWLSKSTPVTDLGRRIRLLLDR